MFDYQKIKQAIGKEIVSFQSLVKQIRLPIEQNRNFSIFLNDLAKKTLIGITKNKDFFIPEIQGEIIGEIRINVKGFGFVNTEQDAIFISAKNTNSAFDRDNVKIKIFKDPLYPKESQGIVVEVIDRNTTHIVGTIKKFSRHIGLLPFNRHIKGVFQFQNQHNIQPGDIVKVEIVDYGRPTLIKVIKKIGRANDPFIDFKIMIEDANVTSNFSSEANLEASQIKQEVELVDLQNRTDLRNELIVTIDGNDTKDFDDAISVAKLENGNYKLFVHIADVTHYVKEHMAIDKEASQRGTSIYLPGQVIPMLPEALSNGICSLNPNVDRLTITAEIEINQAGETVLSKVYPSVINSKFRLTYDQVNDYYKQKKLFENDKLHKMLDDALALSLIIRNYKEKAGFVDLEITESKIIVDQNGKTTNIVALERLESEMLIEDFMVRANEAIAEFVTRHKLPFLYRVHAKPELEKIHNIQAIINALGLEVKMPSNPSPYMFASVVNEIKKTRFDDFMKIIMLRTMSKALYSPINTSHFGLASKFYTHFTSPIRRYPDLMVHRMLRFYFFNDQKDDAAHFQKILPTIATHSSDMEQKALDLERKICDIKKAEFYENYIGQVFKGTIVSMMKFGFFVEFPNKVNGLVHISTLGDRNFQLVNSKLEISNGDRHFKIGDQVEVIVDSVSKNEGKINLLIKGIARPS